MEYPLTIKDVDLSVALQLPTRQVTSQGGQLLSVTWPPDSPSSSASSDALGEENCNIFLELNDELNKVLFDSFTPPAINRSAPIGMQHANSNEKAVVISNTRGYKRKNPNTTKLPPPKMSSATRHMGFIGDDEGNDGNLTAECGETTQSNVPQFSNNKDPLADQQCKTAAKPGNSSSTSSSMSAWQVEDLADNLAELDGSLSGLGVDLSATPYSMSEALLSLPSLTVFKQEAPSPTNGDNVPGNTANDNNANKNLNSVTSLHQLLQQHSTNFGIPTMPVPSSHLESTAVSTMVSSHSGGLGSTMTVSSVATSSTDMVQQRETPMDCRFQYVLAAATSIATKVNEETLTYLNQGQPYEIKLKKLGELSAYRGKILKSVIRICFHERRLQYMEREQMAAWQASRPGDRIVELDVPLSYGVFDVVQDPNSLNTVEFLWDPTKEVGAYIKVNCISTEFTPKKHGGEKGVPFRIQVETYLQSDETSKRLHVAACQIKVFKLKGADRKHKQDREKILKRPMIEQDKFQPSYECTVLNDVPVENPFQSAAASPVAASPNNCIFNSVESSQPRGNNVAVVPVTVMTPKEEPVIAPPSNVVAVPSPVSNCSSIIPDQSPDSPLPVYQQQPLQNEATAQQTVQWLQANRFGQYIRTFISFSGADLLRLSRDDLIQICGLADGIRLFNALHSKTVVPRLTLYLCVQQGAVYHAMYLSTLTRNEMVSKLAQLMGVSREQIRDIYLQGPGGIHILVTDDVVNNIRDEAMFSIEILPADQSGERYRLLLKSVTH